MLALFPASREEAVRIAFDVGNRHFSLALEGDTLLVPDDTAMEHLVSRLGVGVGAARGRCTRRSSREPEAAMTDPRLVSLLHFADSAFPAGGYAHSFGLEHYCQAGIVRDRAGLERVPR